MLVSRTCAHVALLMLVLSVTADATTSTPEDNIVPEADYALGGVFSQTNMALA